MLSAKYELDRQESALDCARAIDALRIHVDGAVDRLRGVCDRLERDCTHVGTSVDALEARVTDTGARVANVATDVRESTVRLEALTSQLRDAKVSERTDRLREELEKQRGELSALTVVFRDEIQRERETFEVATRCDMKLEVLETFLRNKRRSQRAIRSSIAMSPSRGLTSSLFFSSPVSATSASMAKDITEEIGSLIGHSVAGATPLSDKNVSVGANAPQRATEM